MSREITLKTNKKLSSFFSTTHSAAQVIGMQIVAVCTGARLATSSQLLVVSC